MSMYGEYLSKCTHPSCLGKLWIEQAKSAGLTLGSRVPESPFDAAFGRCPICKRHSMVIIWAPEDVVIPRETGFTKIPTE